MKAEQRDRIIDEFFTGYTEEGKKEKELIRTFRYLNIEVLEGEDVLEKARKIAYDHYKSRGGWREYSEWCK